jgi:hypothetical protein
MLTTHHHLVPGPRIDSNCTCFPQEFTFFTLYDLRFAFSYTYGTGVSPDVPPVDCLLKQRDEMFVSKRQEVLEGWRNMHNQELYNLDSSPDIVKGIKAVKMIWTEHVACVEARAIYANFFIEVLKGRSDMGAM